MSRFVRSPLTAVLGPTNTGKTHLAVERMLGHSSGMIGFPLRLLAREIYDRVVSMRGAGSAALVTGEERIWPATARYLLCTTEAMPRSASVASSAGDEPVQPAFVALDEAQIGQDRERGHVFTARMLHARGREETMILGASALRPMVSALLPDAEIVTRPRFSTLNYDGPRKLSRLPPRSVIVAFSAEEVYAIAEALRRFSGGAAVVMGSLSPRTRNAQVAMFQSGEVDYLVATDAVGMGLNLDVSHVAFASLAKFDGVRNRRLTTAEMGQIAGRAGRHQRDGSFGSVGSDSMFTDAEVEAVEAHRFSPIDSLYWRNPDPDMASVDALIASLEMLPPSPLLSLPPELTDLAVLRRLRDDAAAMALATGSDQVRRLWSAASLPDFTSAGVEAHGRLVARIWQELATGGGTIDQQWFSSRVAQLDTIEGSVELIADRIARVRTWCYIAQRNSWLAEAEAMSEAARAVEARLSDALHDALTARFVDRRTTVLLRALGQGSSLPVTVDDGDGAVRVDGEVIGQLEGFAFSVDPSARVADRKMLLAAAERHLNVELAARAAALACAPDAALSLATPAGGTPELHWQGHRVALIGRGRNRLAPQVALEKPIARLDATIASAVVARLNAYIDRKVSSHLRAMVAIATRARDPDAPGPVRAVCAAIVEQGGCAAREPLDGSLRAMDEASRGILRTLGIRVGSLDLFHPLLVKPGALRWIAALESAWSGQALPAMPEPGINLIDAAQSPAPVAGAFRRIGGHWLRVDLVERVAIHAHNQRQRAAATGKRGADKGDAGPPQPDGDVAALPDDDGEGTADRIAIAADAKPPVEGAFRIDPELARSIGLPIEERLGLYRLLGFRTITPPKSVSVEEEPLLWWNWRGRGRVDRPRRADDGAGRSAVPAPARARLAQVALSSNLHGKPRPASGGHRVDAAPPRPATPSPAPNNPFAALAALLGKDSAD